MLIIAIILIVAGVLFFPKRNGGVSFSNGPFRQAMRRSKECAEEQDELKK